MCLTNQTRINIYARCNSDWSRHKYQENDENSKPDQSSGPESKRDSVPFLFTEIMDCNSFSSILSAHTENDNQTSK